MPVGLYLDKFSTRINSLGFNGAAMASQLSFAYKKQLVEHKADFEKNGRKMPFKDQLAYC